MHDPRHELTRKKHLQGENAQVNGLDTPVNEDAERDFNAVDRFSHQSRSILVVGPAWIGDAVMAQSIYKTLKHNDPSVQIDVLSPAWSHAVLDCMPEVRRAITSPFGHGQLQLSNRRKLGKTLRDAQYDQAIVLPNSFKSALIPFWAKIPQRTGWHGESRWGVLNDIRYLDKPALPLMIERFISLGLPKNAPMPTTLPHPRLNADTESCHRALEKHQLPRPKQMLALCPGAEYGPSKRWPARHFADIATRKAQAGWDIWIFGSQKDRIIAEAIQAACGNRCTDLTGKTSLHEAIDLLSFATAVVTNDSGLMHIAAALGRPLVALYGSSSSHFTPPLSEKAKELSLNLDCSPCFQRGCPLGHFQCMQDLHPDRVIETLDTLTIET